SPYVVFVPHDYDGKKEYPVILFLHGAGETKSTKGGGKMPVEVGIGPAIKKQEKTFPFIVVIPQAETRGWGAEGPNAKRALAMLEAIKKAGGNPKYTEYPGVGHNSWDKAYGTKELWTWLLEQKKK